MQLVLLTANDVTELWPVLEPILEASCASNEISAGDITATDIYLLAQTEMCGIFAAMEGKDVVCVAAVQFHEVNGKKGADVIAMGGRHLIAVKSRFWQPIIDWVKSNGAEFIDAYANPRLANIYLKKFGFSKSCYHVRMML